ncbi:hypothetical protein BOTBODRAFT_271109 [Botryobasidium botryosum FD-172 SS1]|uniref:Uncharacterized protein n=1 Tax=Botryobasidium botryosum (strain FD-172 SS1) TaxID=930990 RepID=A0A067LS59_BOTB1|nr:hypothetical protein BOTBODRAFT_271109 [Botryobasidium botryosum FD-172 SS1]
MQMHGALPREELRLSDWFLQQPHGFAAFLKNQLCISFGQRDKGRYEHASRVIVYGPSEGVLTMIPLIELSECLSCPICGVLHDSHQRRGGCPTCACPYRQLQGRLGLHWLGHGAVWRRGRWSPHVLHAKTVDARWLRQEWTVRRAGGRAGL